MKKALNISIILSVFLLVFSLADTTMASWYAGIQRIPNANGITAIISTPSNPLNLVKTGQSGVSNWVSTLYSDSNGTGWIQAGWRYYHWYSIPKQYVEYCINCIGSQGTYFVNEVANQTWGTTVDYWVSRTNNTAQWCATTAGVQRVCVNNLNNAPVKVMAKSEVHDSSLNPLNTYYSQLKYKSPSNNLWYSFDSQRTIHENFPL
jgi:hypothetical protein